MVSGKIYIVEENQDIQNLAVSSSGLEFNGTQPSSLNGDGLVIDKAAYTVYIKGIKVSFPKKEFELLLLLASNPEKFLSVMKFFVRSGVLILNRKTQDL